MAKVSWTLARMEYMLDLDMSFRKIAQKYGCSTRMVEKKAAAEHWYLDRSQTWAKVRYKLRMQSDTVAANC